MPLNHVGRTGKSAPGSQTFNAPATFIVPNGVYSVNLSGRGGAGNSGNPGAKGTSGNPGTNGTGGAGGTAGTAGNPGSKGNAGNPGDDTTISDTGVIFRAKGGGAGGLGYQATACSASANNGGTGASSGGAGGCTTSGSTTAGTLSNQNMMSTVNGYTIGKLGGNGGYINSLKQGGGGGGAGAAGTTPTSTLYGRGGNGVYSVIFGGATMLLEDIFGSAYRTVAFLHDDGLS